MFAGRIPAEIGHLTGLTQLHVSHNQLEGALCRCLLLCLVAWSVCGVLGGEWTKLCAQLCHVRRVTHDTRTDHFSLGIVVCPSRTDGICVCLYVCYLHAFGRVLWRLPVCRVLSYSAGPIPAEIFQLTELTQLNLQSNGLTGACAYTIHRNADSANHA